MAGNATTVFVTGLIYWPKIVGKPVPNYDGDANEWSYDFVPDETDFLKENRLLDRLKEPKPGKNADKGPQDDYLHLRKPEYTKDGDKNDPIRIYNSENEEWDDRKIGNGSRVVVKLRIVDYGKGKKKGIYTTAIRVEELVPYVGNEFGGFDGGTTSEKAAKAPKTPKGDANEAAGFDGASKPQKGSKAPVEDLDDLDDEMPF